MSGHSVYVLGIVLSGLPCKHLDSLLWAAVKNIHDVN